MHNAFNRFRLLSNTQFFEQRVREDEPDAAAAAAAATGAGEASIGSRTDGGGGGAGEGAAPPGRTFEEHVGERYREAGAYTRSLFSSP